MKRSLALILAVLMLACLFAGCGKEEPAPQPEQPSSQGSTSVKPQESTTDITEQGSLVVDKEVTEDTKYADELVVIQDNTKTSVLDPHNVAAATSSTCTVFQMLFNRLIEFQNNEYIPGLATSWETEDQQHFVFHLREGVKFHNGETLTADDVAFTIERATTVGATSNAGTRWKSVESTEVIDPLTIKVNLVSVNVDFLKDITYAGCGILNRKAVEADEEKGTWIGTGAYKVEDFVPNEYGVYVKFDEFWGEPAITQKLTIKFVAEETARLIALQNGEADMVWSINPSEFPAVEADTEHYACYSYIVHNCGFLAFNLEDPICGDLNFRKAVASVMNRDDIILAARNGYAVWPESGSFWGYGTEYKNLDIPFIPYDVEAAKEYLAKSCYNGETIEITSAMPDFTIAAQVLQGELAAIGVTCTINQTDTAGMNAYTAWGNNKGQMMSYTGGWTQLASVCRTYFYPGNSSNRAALNDEEINRLLDLAPTQTDEAEREATYKKVQELVNEQLPFIAYFNIRHVACCQMGVGGMILRNDSTHDYSHIYKIIEG